MRKLKEKGAKVKIVGEEGNEESDEYGEQIRDDVGDV